MDPSGTHALDDLFQRIFIAEINRGLGNVTPFGSGPYAVFQEVDTSQVEGIQDIADIVLVGDQEKFVIENYYTSDGHGHSYRNYRDHACREGHRGAVVLVCRDSDSSRQSEGWEHAYVVTYGRLIAELLERIPSDYAKENREAYSFVRQMHRKFVDGKNRMQEPDVIEFLKTMCESGEAGRYGEVPQEAAAQRFAADVAREAVERFDEGRALLQRLKGSLKRYCEQVLRPQLEQTMGDRFVGKISAEYQGRYQWTINLRVSDLAIEGGEGLIQLKFGPSAWFANEQDPRWTRTIDPASVDYSRLLLTRSHPKELRQSRVRLQEVLDGLSPEDGRLHDELVSLWRGKSP